MRSIVTAVVLFALSLTACGESAAPEERLAAAADTTAGEGTAKMAMDIASQFGDQAGAGMDMTMSAEGVVDFDAEQSSMTMEVPGMGEALRTVVDGDVVYTEVPPMLGGGDQTQWVRQDRGGSAPGMSTGPSPGGVGEDPASMVEALTAVQGEISELGTDEVRDVEVQGYGFTVAGDELQPGDEAAGAAGFEVPMEAWLDADDRVRKLVTKVDLADAMKSARANMSEDQAGQMGEALGQMSEMNGTMTVTIELFAFGEDVDIEVPADEEAIDAAEFESRLNEQMRGLEDAGGAQDGTGDAEGSADGT